MENSMLKNLGDKAKDTYDKTTDYLNDAKDSVTENVGNFVDAAKDKAKEGLNDAGEAVQKAYEKAKK